MAGEGSDPAAPAARAREGLVHRGRAAAIESKAAEAVEQAVRFARESAFPPLELIEGMVYADG